MSTSLLYHAFGLRGYDYVSTKYVSNEVIFHISPKPDLLRCPICKKREVKRRGFSERKLRLSSMGGKLIYVRAKVPRVECLSCGAIRQIATGIAEPRRTYTRSFERLVLELSQSMTMLDVARFLKIGWDTVKDIVKRNLKKRFSKPKLGHLKNIAIDEISVAKGHKYLTVVLDLDSGKVVFVGDGKGSDALMPFWKRLKKSRAKIEAISIDMSPAYIAAVLENCPKAALVFDHFHIVKLMNEHLTDLRRRLYHEQKNCLEKDVLKGARWILLKRPENLKDKYDERQRLNQALELNAPLATAYYLKEDLRQIWMQPDKQCAAAVIDSWIEVAQTSGIAPLVKMGNTLQKYRFGILNWYDHPISSGPMEGTNNKIKTLKRQAYGFRDLEFFKLKILDIHHTKYALVG